MNESRLLNNFVVRNLVGLVALMGVHLLTDLYAIGNRPGILKISPYFYLVLLYGWVVFHNRVLFEGLFLRGRKGAYFGWLLLLMAIGSFNMNFVLDTQFGITRSLPYVVSFWVYTVTGLGVYITYRFLRSLERAPSAEQPVTSMSPAERDSAGVFSCLVDSNRLDIPYMDVQYIESLENYLKVFTASKTYVTRLTLKEAEVRLPKRQFVRVSRSHIVNTAYVKRLEQDALLVGEKEIRIGKVYKRHVLEQFSGS